MPACGKSTIAKKFAKQINYDFIDIDEYIEEKNKQKISDIFKTYGEAKFREFENLALKEILKKKYIVVATGGGLPCFYNNMQLMNASGKTIYLKVDMQTLFNRIKADLNIRPLLQQKTDEEIKLYLKQTINEREIFYKQANFTIDAKNDISKILEVLN